MREQSVAAGLSMILVLTVAVGLAGAALSATEADPDHHVHIEDSAFDPQDLIVRPGEIVEWDNHDSVPHDATADNGDWATKQAMGEGESDTVLFENSGTWSYHCTVHPSITGTLTVNLPAETAITSHSDGETVQGLTTLEGTASDSDGTVEYVEVRTGGGDWENATGTTSWSYEWDTLFSPNGDNLVEVRAYDGVEHSEPVSITLDVDNPLFVDLEINEDDIQVSPAEPGDLFAPKSIEVTVHNHGNDHTVFDLIVEYESNGQTHIIDERSLALGAFDSTTTTVFWEASDKIGDFEITAAADRAGETGDVDPENNEATTTGSVVIGGVPGTDSGDLLP